MGNRRYDHIKVEQYFGDGRAGTLPDPIAGQTLGSKKSDSVTPARTLPFTEKQLARDLLPMMVKDGGANASSTGWDTHEYISKLIPHLWEVLEGDSYENLDGNWFVGEFKISKTNTPIVYELLGDVKPSDVFNALEQGVKDEIIFHHLKGYRTRRTYGREMKYYSPAFYEYHLRRDGSVEREGHAFLVNQTQRLINKWFFDQEDSGINIYGKKSEEIAKVKAEVKGTRTHYGQGGSYEVATVKEVTGRKAIDAARKKAIEEHKKRASLKYKDLLKEAGKEGKAESFFKTLEQCFLLTAVPELAAVRSNQRKENINSKHVPYGGRVIPIDCEPAENFINYASTTSDLYVHTLSMTTPVLNSIKYKFVVSNVVTKERDGEVVEIEEPILFGGQKNILSYDQEPVFKNAILYNKDGNEQVSSYDINKLVEIGIDHQSDVNKLIHYSDLSISFIGENQATAKTNVDVTLKLRMPNLTYLQTEFIGTTTYTKSNGDEVAHQYTYSPVDLISYLNRSNLKGTTIPVLKHKGGAKLYSPKFYRTYNRLVLKIIPVISKDPEIEVGSDDDNIVEALREYLESTSMILDLALVDHTISRIDKTEGEVGDEITIDYKGYIRSRLQDPIFDCLRNKTQMETLKGLEKKLITDLSGKDPGDPVTKKKIFDEIQKTNDQMNNSSKTHKTDFKKNIFTRLRNNNRIYRMEYDPVDLLDLNVSKEFKIIGAKKLSEAVKKTIPKIVQIKNASIDLTSITENNGKEKKLLNDFFYFGDLVDVLMNNLYLGDPREKTKVMEAMEADFKNFPLKVILPSFYPIALMKDADGEMIFKTSDAKINLADFPIAVSWLDHWIDKNIIDSDVAFYSLGPLMNSIVSSLINGMLVEDCYMNGSAEFLQFAVKSEFGLFGGKAYRDSNTDFKNENRTWLNAELLNDGRVFGVGKLEKNNAPFFLKDPRLPMSEHCNFLVIYQQISVFANYNNLSIDAGSMANNGIPYFNINGKNQYGDPNPLTSGMTFNKATANYQRETRFQMESLFSLSQLASVYNISIDTNQMLLDLYPGMLVYADAGLYQDASIKGSIANTLGMGGFHLTEKITHTAKIAENVLTSDTTKIEANWVYSGEGSQFTTNSPPAQNNPTPKKNP
jgi:hypothetical protein